LSFPSLHAQPVLADNAWGRAGYQFADGAMPVHRSGDFVEPYFAVKALLMAHRLGLDVRAETELFARWLAPRQRPDGRFARYCRAPQSANPATGSAAWADCGVTDADDALAALWCLLVVELLPDSRYDRSCVQSLALLAQLWNPRQQVYRTLVDKPFAQFADNIEILAALTRLQQADARARFQSTLGKYPTQLSVGSLTRGVEKTFAYSFRSGVYAGKAADFSELGKPMDFYPDGVTALYVWIYGLQAEPAARRGWQQWKTQYQEAWLAGRTDAFPWGLGAVAAEQLGDRAVSADWLDRASAWRGAGRWNLLEEGVWQGLNHRLSRLSTDLGKP